MTSPHGTSIDDPEGRRLRLETALPASSLVRWGSRQDQERFSGDAAKLDCRAQGLFRWGPRQGPDRPYGWQGICRGRFMLNPVNC